MARVNVETRALAESRFYKLMRTMKWDRSKTIGVLTLLWHDSQERLKIHATKPEILDWIDAGTKEEAETIFTVLIECQYLTEIESNVFYIRGNKKHVESNEARTISAIKAGLASGKSRKNNTLEESMNGSRTSRSESRTVHEPNAMQFNAKQSNTIQKECKASRSKKPAQQPIPLPEQVSAEWILGTLKENQIQNLKKLYPDEKYIERQLISMVIWVESNRHKSIRTPLGWMRFITNWLNKSWDNHQKGLSSTKKSEYQSGGMKSAF